MAFHEIDSVTNINSGHRIIIYYIENKSNEIDLNVKNKLHKDLEAVMRTLEKKNDGVLVVKLLNDSEQFTKFNQLYKPEVKGQVTLFVVNNEGIPILSEHIHEDKNISAIILSICNVCALHPISATDFNVKSESKLPLTITNGSNTKTDSTSIVKSAETMSQTESKRVENNVMHRPTGNNNSALEPSSQHENSVDSPSSTQLQIRLPDGSRHQQQFDKEAALNEVWVFISTQYKLKAFDLKTYNHQNFSEDDYESTLQDLDLYPNGVLIVVPKHVVSNNNSGWISSWFQFGLYQLVLKTTNTFSYIQGILVMFWNRVFSSNNRPRDGNNGRRNQIQTTQKSNRPSDQPSSQRRSKSSTSSFGNVHTLRRNDDSDDENNRYNGNSTQQK